MSIAISSRGIWDRGYPISDEDTKLAKRCERDTRLDREFSELKAEGHKPCTSPDKYRPMTETEIQELERLLAIDGEK